MPVLTPVPGLNPAPKTRIVEVFSSLQGEGTRLGERQIFALDEATQNLGWTFIGSDHLRRVPESCPRGGVRPR